MNVIINGEAKEMETGSSVADLVERLSLPNKRVAVEVNLEVVRRDEWSTKDLEEGDRVEIVHFVGGG